MKVFQINTVLNSGSTGMIAGLIGDRLLDLGHESHVAYGRGHAASRSRTHRMGSTLSQGWHLLKTRTMDRHGFASRTATRGLVRAIEKAGPDVVHLHNLHGYYLHIGILADFLRSFGKPVVWTFHDCWPFTGHCTHFVSAGCMKWEEECHACPKTRYYPASLVVDNSRKNFRDKKRLFAGLDHLTIVTPSRWLSKWVERSFLREKSCRVIPNGIDLELYRPIPQPNPERIVLGVANTWHAQKGLNDFIGLCELLPDPFRIVLIGLDPRQTRGLPEKIIPVGRTKDREELVQWYSRASVFANPTRQDNFPTTNLEALACGTPVVTYRTGGSPESVDGKTGRVVEQGDLQGFSSAILELANGSAEEVREACRQRAERFYNRDDRYREYVDLYQEVHTGYTNNQ